MKPETALLSAICLPKCQHYPDEAIFEQLNGISLHDALLNAVSELEQGIPDVYARYRNELRPALFGYYGIEDGRPRTMLEIANTMGLSRNRIWQVIHKALRQLRHRMRAEPLMAYIKGYKFPA